MTSTVNTIKVFDNAPFLDLSKITNSFNTRLDWAMDFELAIAEQLSENGITFTKVQRVCMKHVGVAGNYDGLVATHHYRVSFSSEEDRLLAMLLIGGKCGSLRRAYNPITWKVIQ